MSAGPFPGPLQCSENTAPALGAIVVAAGSSTRMGGIDKAFTPLLGMPLIAHCLDQLETFTPVARIALVLSQQSLGLGEDMVALRKYTKVSNVCAGGARRQDSVRLGLESLGPCEWVLVHDGARPCLDHSLLERGWDAVRSFGAALAGVPVKDTIKVVSPEQTVLETPPPGRALGCSNTAVFSLRPVAAGTSAMPGTGDRRRYDGGAVGAPRSDVSGFLRKLEDNNSG